MLQKTLALCFFFVFVLSLFLTVAWGSFNGITEGVLTDWPFGIYGTFMTLEDVFIAPVMGDLFLCVCILLFVRAPVVTLKKSRFQGGYNTQNV